MPSDDFPNAPDMGREFFNNRRIDPRAKAHDKPDPEPSKHYPDLDHLELNLDYTPGGRLEQDVHTQLSESGRRENQARLHRTEPSQERDYLSQMQEKLQKQIDEKRREQDAKEGREEAAAERAEQEEARQKTEQQEKEAADQKQRTAPSYDMPEQGEDASAPASPPPPSIIRPRPGRLGPGERDRSDGGHER